MKPIIWIGGRIPSPFLVDEPTPCRPDLVLWLDLSHDQVLAADVVEPGVPSAVLAERLGEALAMKANPRPSVVRVPDSASADAIRAALPAGIRIEIGPTPELAAIVELMGEKIGGAGHPHSYLENRRIPHGVVACMFREAATLHRLAPWRKLADSDVLAMDVPALGVANACLSVIGAMKQNFGVLVFDSFDDYDEFGSREPGSAAASVGRMDIGVELLSLAFERGADVPDSMRREVAAHSWPVAGPRAYPVVWAAERTGDVRPLTTRDMQLATAAACGVATLFSRHRQELGGSDPRPAAEILTVEVPEPVEVTIRFPHPDASAEMLGVDPPSERDYERMMECATSQVRKFLSSRAVANMAKDWRDDAGFVCETLHRTKVDYTGGPWSALTPRYMDWFLIEHYPRKVSADARTIGRTPEILHRYFEWLGAEGLEPAATVARLKDRLERVREEFLEVAGNPENFGPAKSFVMEMHAAGVDFSDQAAVTEFMEKHNQHLDAGRRRREKSAPAGGSGHVQDAHASGPRPGRVRWQPTPEHPAPPPDTPCPCGRGRRYKSCCMPR